MRSFVLSLRLYSSCMMRWFFVFGIAGSAFTGCKSAESQKLSEDLIARTPVDSVFVLQKQKFSSSLHMPGELIAYQQVDLYAKVNSFIKKLSVDVGSEVKSGQLLAVMEAPEINSQLSGAESRLTALQATYNGSKANYNRLLETSKTPGTISPNELDLAYAREQSDLAQLQASKAASREIQETKNYLQIRAPFAGLITARNVSEGAYVGPSGKGSELPLFTLQEQKKLRLVVAVPELYTSYLTEKTTIHFTVKSLPDNVFTATIQRRAGALDSRLRSQRVEMDVMNAGKKLLPGMVAEISISLNATDSSFLVPETAIINSAEGIFVIRSANGKAEWITIKKGRADSGKTEVFGSLQPGDSLITHASEEIRNGSVLR